ncbi:uncharacterized protein LOC109859339 [Pseudomyrmex gracilis]|uniref:uncharacterized protein LOC109859339 n=1 Tax=Pseudomyrmex gracilis TaxID=219809 RepID=UPI000994ABDB|nr:uncharacterized protein LOC109859339 [Pseudomyrmex gracilis]
MLVTKVFPLTVLFLVSFGSEERDYSRAIFRSSSLKESQEYFQQCHPVDVWNEHLGYVSVLTFLDFFDEYIMAKSFIWEIFNLHLQESGFSDVRVFAIFLSFDMIEDEWMRSLVKKDLTPQILTEFNDNFNHTQSKVTFFLDNPQLRLWQRFRASKDQVVVIDRCGRLTYKTMFPMTENLMRDYSTLLQYSDVKAAIRSTYNDDPCGGCDPTVYKAYLSSAVNNTDKEADPNKTDDNVNVDLKTANIENFEINFNESLEKNREASTVSAVLDEATDDTGNVTRDFSNATGSTESEAGCRCDKSATESSLDESNANGTEGTRRNQEDSSTVPAETVATNFEVQQDIPPKQEVTAHTSSDDDAVTAGYVEIENNSTSAAETTTLDAVGDDGVRQSDGNTDVSANNPDTCGQNKSICNANVASKDTYRLEQDPLPLRIIMQAPHLHKREMKKHTYLILKLGDPKFHGHLNSGIDVKPSINSRQDASIEAKSTEEQETVDTDKKDADQNYVFDMDEGPGLYGEVADYWRTEEDNDIIDENESYKSTIIYNEETKEDKTFSSETTK